MSFIRGSLLVALAPLGLLACSHSVQRTDHAAGGSGPIATSATVGSNDSTSSGAPASPCGADQVVPDYQGGTACWQTSGKTADVAGQRAYEDGFLYRSGSSAGARYHLEVVTTAEGKESGEVESVLTEGAPGSSAPTQRRTAVAYVYDPATGIIEWQHHHADGTVFSSNADSGGAADRAFFAELVATEADDLDKLLVLRQTRLLASDYGRTTLPSHVIGWDDIILLGIGALIGGATAYYMCENADWFAPENGFVCGSTKWVKASDFDPSEGCKPADWSGLSNWTLTWHNPEVELYLCCDPKERECKTYKGVEPCHTHCP
jgi:hypothetical protein